ncbi:hypothetical protein BBK82_38315 [Lentzea guizhouensis]|uniref:Uncharacterized protein n=1 Tax=Lentzea guizhouensis TaxID=1586287 RepID=A0A1B2HTE0_9PSEU|nr:hypothetical protein [Lentzea guizhouensis]ANZ40973.1 hypothetical protein BBK82_38315 [Lentzea guizhouensis]
MTPDSRPAFDIVETAGFYSQLAGVLAGFAFAAIMVLLTARLIPSQRAAGGNSQFNSATRMLVVCFIGLVLASLNYAVLAGDTPGKIRAATLELVGGVGFATAGLLLIYAMVLTFDDVSAVAQGNPADAVGDFLRSLLITVLTPLILLFIYLSVQDFNQIAHEKPGAEPIHEVSWLLIATQISLSTIDYLRHRKTTVTFAERDRAVQSLARTAIAAVVATSILFAVLSAFLTSRSEPDPLEAIPYVAMVVSTIGAISFTHHLARTRPR